MHFRLAPRSMTLMILNCYKFKFSRNFALLRIFGRPICQAFFYLKIQKKILSPQDPATSGGTAPFLHALFGVVALWPIGLPILRRNPAVN